MPVVAKRFLTEETARTEYLSTIQVRSALVADVLRRNGEPRRGPLPLLRLRVHGESMLPALWPGDIVEIAPCSITEVKSGEIVLALRDGRLFLHRLVSVSEGGFLLRGDSVPCADAMFPQEALLGRLVQRVDERRIYEGRQLTRRTLRAGLGAKCSRMVGLLFCYWSSARRAALSFHNRVHRRGGACARI